jgi:Family of unknown function (DUF6186)
VVTSRVVTLAIWGVLGAGFIVCWAVSVLRPAAIPTPRAAVGAVASSRPGRVLLFLGWMWLGWHLFAR